MSSRRRKRIRIIYRHEPYLALLGGCYLISGIMALALLKGSIDIALYASLFPIGTGWLVLGIKVKSRPYIIEGVVSILAFSLGMIYLALYGVREVGLSALTLKYLILTSLSYVLMLAAYMLMTICLYMETYARPGLKYTSGAYLLWLMLMFGALPYARLTRGYGRAISIFECAMLVTLVVLHVINSLILIRRK